MRLAHPTISTQIRLLEQRLGTKLFSRQGRNLVLTDTGRTVYRFADDIFATGQRMVETVMNHTASEHVRLVVGVSDVLAKSIVHRILEPAFRLGDRVRIECRESQSTEAFMAELAAHSIDVILSDTPPSESSPVRAFSHPLGECGTTFFAARKLARACRPDFPRSLDGVPVLLPSRDSTFRRALNDWFDTSKVRPKVTAELDDAALAAVLGEAGLGVFAAPDVIEKEIQQRYKVEVVGRAKAIRQRFYAISIERTLRHPGVVAICESARKHIFG